ncbi:hypothetical protein, partial [Serratia marcescens]|uniref:hypothetical protein n=1 Tax=Serratia marcescens TaxID=615 RepID=UPI0019D3E060
SVTLFYLARAIGEDIPYVEPLIRQDIALMNSLRHRRLTQFLLTLAAGFSVYGHALCCDELR